MFQVHHVIAFLEIRKIDVQGRACGQSVRRFEAARSLDLITTEYLGVRHRHKFARVKQEAAGQGADQDLKRLGGRGGATSGRRRFGFDRGLFKTVFLPNLLETLAFAVVVAEDLDVVVLAQPAMQLGEELASLSFGHMRFGSVPGDGTKSVEVLELWRTLVIRDGFRL